MLFFAAIGFLWYLWLCAYLGWFLGLWLDTFKTVHVYTEKISLNVHELQSIVDVFSEHKAKSKTRKS